VAGLKRLPAGTKVAYAVLTSGRAVVKCYFDMTNEAFVGAMLLGANDKRSPFLTMSMKKPLAARPCGQIRKRLVLAHRRRNHAARSNSLGLGRRLAGVNQLKHHRLGGYLRRCGAAVTGQVNVPFQANLTLCGYDRQLVARPIQAGAVQL